MKKMIDISYHNGSIDFKKVKAAGIEGVIIRAGYGQSTIDVMFKKYIKDALAVGLPVGIYWFSYAYTKAQAKAEALMCLSAINPYKITLPVFFDWEYDSMNYAKKHGVTPNKALITEMTKVFCEEIAKAGYKAGFYYNNDYKVNYYDLSALKGYVKWFARYTSAKQTDCDIWQYSSSGKVAGCQGNVDMDYLINTKLLTGGKETSSTPTKSIDEIAQEVIAGKWGNGDSRKEKLSSSGYDYAAVQNRVNEILSSKEKTYTVQKGDTLTAIAKKYNTTVDALVKKNNIKDKNKIKVGQEIKV